MGYPGEEIGKLGFGMMRLPKKGDEFDIEQIKQMVDCFMDAGFTYFDTAWAYNGSEEATAEALVKRYPRESYRLATKCSAWIMMENAEQAKNQFNISLERTGAGYFDYYLLHNLGEARTHFFDDFGLWDWIAEMKAGGKIKHMGFSFHSTPEELEELLTAHPQMEFVQLQINYADWDNPAIRARECYEVARKHGKSVVIMEPVKGGMLANPPESVAAVFKAAEPESSVASWAIRYAADLDGLITVLSGMSSLEQVQDNVSYMKDFHGLTDAQRETIKKAQEELAKIPIIPCTTCDYCAKVCPNDIGISGTFTAYNNYLLYHDEMAAKGNEAWTVEAHGKKRAIHCLQCGKCEEVCPQHINIRERLEECGKFFGEGLPFGKD